MILHAGLVALPTAEGWRGLLITGPSGAGKSDLALRLIETGFSLVADDRVLIWESGGALYGRAPDSLAGLIEARGLGIVRRSYRPYARIALAVACAPAQPVDRMPEKGLETHLGVKLASLKLDPFEASTLAKLRRTLSALGEAEGEAY